MPAETWSEKRTKISRAHLRLLTAGVSINTFRPKPYFDLYVTEPHEIRLGRLSMVLNESSQTIGDILVRSIPAIMFLIMSIIVIYIMIRLVFLRQPPDSKPSQERHGEYLR